MAAARAVETCIREDVLSDLKRAAEDAEFRKKLLAEYGID